MTVAVLLRPINGCGLSGLSKFYFLFCNLHLLRFTMPKAASAKTSKAATSKANAKSSKTGGKEKRAPTAYNIFISNHMSEWKASNPGSKNKDAMKALGAMWATSEENPNRGKPSTKKSKGRAAPASSSPTSSRQAKDDAPSSDGIDVA
ncbi:hypothetical protein D9757_002226 [Collybiopsis confluens]|uniref:HMG box domain-containing protein n=1 Tax=Collybiopsis confluens TaxID=2823264 RepID=A0A8H5I019_9AGAR|nr:hypothetical protein D9757_002226 [Collybiopsis confluens]